MRTEPGGSRKHARLAFVVRPNCVGKALSQVIATFWPAAAIQDARNDDAEAAHQLIEGDTSNLYLLEVESESSADAERTGILVLQPQTAIVDLCHAVVENAPARRPTIASIRSYFREPEHLGKRIHDLRNALQRFRQRPSKQEYDNLSDELSKLQHMLLRSGRHDEVDTIQRISKKCEDDNSKTVDEIADFLDDLEGRLFENRSRSQASPKPAASSAPPPGYNMILAADDDGLLLLNAWKARLEAMGYIVRVVDSLDAARHVLASTPPAVFVCDLGWKDADCLAGLRCIREVCSKSSVRLVVAMSAAEISSETLPQGAANLSSGDVKSVAGALRLHNLVCERASSP